MKANLIEAALKEYGVHELAGKANSSRVLQYFADSGNSWVQDDTNYAWCSAFMNFVSKEAGLPMTGSLKARSWLDAGQPVERPKIGDVVVFWRDDIKGPNGHVSLFVRNDDDGKTVWVLGGNQSDAVNVMRYDRTKVLGYRDITKPWPAKPARLLREGSFGDDVKDLQKILKVLPVDGAFGPITKAAVVAFQKESGLAADGIVGPLTWAKLRIK